MIGAYLAECVFTQFRINIAEVTAVQKGTPFVFPENKMSCGTACNILLKAFAEFSSDGAVTGKAFIVYVYLPAYATVVVALIGNAFKFFIILWGIKLHGLTFY